MQLNDVQWINSPTWSTLDSSPVSSPVTPSSLAIEPSGVCDLQEQAAISTAEHKYTRKRSENRNRR